MIWCRVPHAQGSKAFFSDSVCACYGAKRLTSGLWGQERADRDRLIDFLSVRDESSQHSKADRLREVDGAVSPKGGH